MACGEIDLMQAIPRFHRPRRAHSSEVVEAPEAFWRSEKVSRGSPNARDAHNQEAGGRILEVTKVQAYQIYVDHMDSKGMSAMGYTYILRARPPEVRVRRHSDLTSCCCEICDNVRVGWVSFVRVRTGVTKAAEKEKEAPPLPLPRRQYLSAQTTPVSRGRFPDLTAKQCTTTNVAAPSLWADARVGTRYSPSRSCPCCPGGPRTSGGPRSYVTSRIRPPASWLRASRAFEQTRETL